jgi:hypothetical protein
VTSTGSTKWFGHFETYVYQSRVFLIFYGVESHFESNIVSAAEDNDITLSCLAINCTYEMQPVDTSLLRPFK